MPTWGDQFETGLRDNFEATIVSSRWGKDARYQGGEPTLLIWKLNGIDSDGIAFEEDLLITIGKGWTTFDGLTLSHESGNPDKNFNKSSHIAKLIDRVCTWPDAREVLASRSPSVLQAGVWEGFRFRFAQEQQNYGAGIEPSNKLLPTEFLGVVGAAPAAAAAPVAQAPAAQTVAPAPAAAPATNGAPAGNVAIRAQVVAAAGAAATFAEFLEVAMALDGIMTDPIMAEVANEATGIYAQVKAGQPVA